MKGFDLLGSENGVFVYLNLGIFSDPVGESRRGDAVLFLNFSISFAGLIERDNGFLKFFAVLCGAVFVRHVCFSFLFFLVSYSNTLVHFFRIHPQQQRKNDKNIEKEKNILPPKSPQGEGQAEDLTVETAGGAAEAAIRPKTPVQGFEEFWKAFPKKASKGSALKAWNKLRPGKELREKIMAAIERAKKSEQWNRENGRFIPYPATWLHAQGWEDELEPQNKAKAQTTYNIEAFEQSGAFDDLDWRP